MRRHIAGFLTILLIMSTSGFAITEAASTVKPGASCTKKNSTQIVNNKKYTCIALKKKLVWSNGVTFVDKSTPKPLANPAKNQSCPAVTEFKKLEPATASMCDIQANAQYEILNYFEKQTPRKMPIKAYLDPKIPSAWMKAELTRLDDAYTFWYSIFQPDEVIEIYWLKDTPKQVDWANKIWQSYQGKVNGGAHINSLDPSPTSCMAANSVNFIIYDFQKNLKIKDNFITNTCAGEREAGKEFKSIHEFTHLMQTSLHIPQQGPSWLTEGGAEIFGEYLGNYRANPSLLFDWRVNKSRAWLPTLGSFTASDWTTFWKDQESPWGDAHVAYYAGAFINEYLIGIYGIEKYKDFLKYYLNAPLSAITPERVDIPVFLDKALMSAYGISRSELIGSAQKYLEASGKFYESMWQ